MGKIWPRVGARARGIASAARRLALAEWQIIARNFVAVAGALLSTAGVLVFHNALGALVRIPLDIVARERRHHRERAEAAELDALERGAVRFVAQAARGDLVENAIGPFDMNAFIAAHEAKMGDPDFMPVLPSWAPDTIVERGIHSLTIEDHWNDFAQLLRDHAEHFSAVIGPYAPSLPLHVRSLVDVILTACERAAEGAAAAALEASTLRNERARLAKDEIERHETAFAYARSLFFGGLQWMIGRVEALEQSQQIDDEIARLS